MRSFLASILILFGVLSAQAKTIFISDVDDTIKFANIQSWTHAALYASDTNSRFMGMSELYGLIKKDNPEMPIYYLSKAPSWLMENIHLGFLNLNKYPAGTYIPRTNYSASEHKILVLRELMEKEKPDQVIMFGDNGEQDSQVYQQIKNEFQDKGIRFYQFIHLVYASLDHSQVGSIPTKDQVGYVSPLEVALDLFDQGLLKSESVQWVVENIVPSITKELKKYSPLDALINSGNGALDRSVGVWAFPNYQHCEDFVWKWDEVEAKAGYTLTEIKNLIGKRCQF